MPNTGRLYTVIELGSTYVRCFAARKEQNEWKIDGIGVKASYGIRNGLVVDVEAAGKTVLAALHAAEKMAKEPIAEVITLVNGVTPFSETLCAQTQIEQVTNDDIMRLKHEIMGNYEREDKSLLHFLPHHYVLDDNIITRDPRRMHGKKLEMHATCIWGDATALRNIEAVIANCNLEHSRHVLAPLMGGYATLIDQELSLGSLLIEMGGGTTDAVLFERGDVTHVSSVRLGGQNITNDIARGLSTPIDHAERLKTTKGNILPFGSSHDKERIDIQRIADGDGSGMSNTITSGALSSIILPRVEEIMEILRDDLHAHGIDTTRYQNVVLSGGACKLIGALEYTHKIFQRPTRIAGPRRLGGMAEATTGPEFAASIGVFHFLDIHDEHPKVYNIEKPQGQFAKVLHWLKNNFLD